MRNLLWLVLLFVPACSRPPLPPEPDVVVVDRDAGLVGDAPLDVYDRACLRLAALGRPEAAPAPDGGMSCHDVLQNAQERHLSEYAPACVADAGSVTALCACAPAWRYACR